MIKSNPCCVSVNVCFCYLSQVEEKAGVLSSFRQIGQEHCDTDQQHCAVFPHTTQRLNTKTDEEESIQLINILSINQLIG